MQILKTAYFDSQMILKNFLRPFIWGYSEATTTLAHLAYGRNPIYPGPRKNAANNATDQPSIKQRNLKA